jgi:hypothetical protein
MFWALMTKKKKSPLSIGALYGSLQSVTIPETANIQIVLLKMSTAMLDTC